MTNKDEWFALNDELIKLIKLRAINQDYFERFVYQAKIEALLRRMAEAT